MGPNAQGTMAGKALIRGVERAIRDMREDELRANLTDIRNRLDMALQVPETREIPAVTFADFTPLPIPEDFDTEWNDGTGNHVANLVAGD